MKVKINKYNKKSERKISVDIDKFDTWSLDHTLALIILPALIQLKETKHGIPSDFAETGGESHSEQMSFDFYQESQDWAFEQRVKEWDEVLDKMIWSFEQIMKDEYDSLYHHGDAKYDWLETNNLYPNPITGKMEKTYKMVDKNPDEHWYDHVGHKLHEDRIQEGLELFGKYYRTLWD
jgi:hypothetical protein